MHGPINIRLLKLFIVSHENVAIYNFMIITDDLKNIFFLTFDV